jgi:hypothetical protein
LVFSIFFPFALVNLCSFLFVICFVCFIFLVSPHCNFPLYILKITC